MMDFFWHTFKATVGAIGTILLPGLGTLIVTTVEKGTGFDIPAGPEAWFIGLFTAAGAWLAIWAAKNTAKP